MAKYCERTSSRAFLRLRAGFSLLEVLVAVLLTAIIVTGTFSGLLTTRKNAGRSDNRVLAAIAQRQLLETLQNYQTASNLGSDATSGPGGGGNSWHLPGDACKPCSGPNCSPSCGSNACAASCYALDVACAHTVTTQYMPARLQNPPLNGQMCYTVTDESGAGGGDLTKFQPRVNVYILWNEPAP